MTVKPMEKIRYRPIGIIHPKLWNADTAMEPRCCGNCRSKLVYKAQTWKGFHKRNFRDIPATFGESVELYVSSEVNSALLLQLDLKVNISENYHHSHHWLKRGQNSNFTEKKQYLHCNAFIICI
jgi:hypothetical protein